MSRRARREMACPTTIGRIRANRPPPIRQHPRIVLYWSMTWKNWLATERLKSRARAMIAGFGRLAHRTYSRAVRLTAPLEKWIRRISGGRIAARDVGILAGLAIALGVTGLIGYSQYESRVTKGVGFVQASEMPVEDTVDVRAKKKAFFDFMRPIVKAENARIRETRERLIAAREANETPGWIADVAARYKVEWTGEEWTLLLKRVDAVPLPLVLAQAANESSWGQSRFAQRGNNMFGQWCFSEGCGIVPNRRDSGKSHEVAAYDTVNASVRSYLRNINTTGAYRGLREIRWQARQQGRSASAAELAAGLSRYSERGSEYVSEIRAMIRTNRSLMLAEAGPE